MSRLRISALFVTVFAAVMALTPGNGASAQARQTFPPMIMYTVAPAGIQQQPTATQPTEPSDTLPIGDGRDVTMRVCTGCHGVNVFSKKRYPEDGWNSVIQRMISRGMDATDDDLATITKYLTTYMAPTPVAKPSADSPTRTPPARASR